MLPVSGAFTVEKFFFRSGFLPCLLQRSKMIFRFLFSRVCCNVKKECWKMIFRSGFLAEFAADPGKCLFVLYFFLFFFYFLAVFSAT